MYTWNMLVMCYVCTITVDSVIGLHNIIPRNDPKSHISPGVYIWDTADSPLDSAYQKNSPEDIFSQKCWRKHQSLPKFQTKDAMEGLQNAHDALLDAVD